MSERDIFKEYIPQIVETAFLLKDSSEKEFESWKNETLASSDKRSREFIQKVIKIVEMLVEADDRQLRLVDVYVASLLGKKKPLNNHKD